jgi:hypothetical protein
MTAVALLLGTVVVVIGALLFTCLLRLGSIVSFALAAYLVAWAEVVTVVFALSAVHRVERAALLLALCVPAGVAAVLWLSRGRPRPPSLRQAARNGWSAAADPLVAIPLVVSAASMVYTLVVSVTTAPNDGDPLVYELTRAAFWRQEHGIVNLGAAYDGRIDYSPPVAETGNLAVLVLNGADRFVGLTQWLSVLVLALGTYGIARRVGLDRRPALWSASLVPMFPVVATQSWSAFTDLVFSSFALCAVYFGIGELGLELIPFGLAVALGLGTKLLGPILAPLLVLIVGLAQPARSWTRLACVAIAAAAVSGPWYLRTQLAEGDPAGNSGVGLQSREVAPILTTLHRLAADLFDLSGAAGSNEWLYPLAALGVVCVAVARYAWRRRVEWTLLVAAVLISLTPLAITLVGRGWAWVGVEVWEAAGRADLVDQLRGWRSSTVSDGAFSWLGPIGVVLALGGVPVAVAGVRTGEVTRTALALGAAPLVALLLVSVTIAYQRYEGRYFVATFALCLATCGGFALRHRWVGATFVGLAAVTVFLTLVNSLGRPTGLPLLAGDPGRSIWAMPRWEQQGILRSTPPERDEVLTMRFVEEHVPRDASLGIALTGNSFGFPYFGPHLERTLAIVDDGDVLPETIDWLVASPGRNLLGCRDAWTRRRLGAYGWSVWRRTSPETCSAPEPLA